MTPTDARTAPPLDNKEAAIIAAACKAFLARGYDNASMDAIALEAGVSKRTVYNRFRSKEALFAAAIMETCRNILPLDIETLEASVPFKEFLPSMAEQFLRGVLAPDAIALRRIAAFEADRNPALGKAYLELGPRMMVEIAQAVFERSLARQGRQVEDPRRAIWQLGALLTEPLFNEILMGEYPDDLDTAIEKQITTGLAAFYRIYDLDEADPKADDS